MRTLVETAAFGVALSAHMGQVDKAGRDYMDHVRAVAESPRLIDDDERAAAWMHDVIEDTPDMTIQHLLDSGFPVRVAFWVQTLTRKEGETYDDYISRVSKYDATRRIKLADLDDHLAPERIHVLSPSMVARYAKAREFLEGMV